MLRKSFGRWFVVVVVKGDVVSMVDHDVFDDEDGFRCDRVGHLIKYISDILLTICYVADKSTAVLF